VRLRARQGREANGPQGRPWQGQGRRRRWQRRQEEEGRESCAQRGRRHGRHPLRIPGDTQGDIHGPCAGRAEAAGVQRGDVSPDKLFTLPCGARAAAGGRRGNRGAQALHAPDRGR